MTKKINISLIFILLLSLIPFINIEADNIEQLYDINNYNIYLKGNHSADTADVEGGMAVKGYSTFGSSLNTFSYGAMFAQETNIVGRPAEKDESVSLLIGETVNIIDSITLPVVPFSIKDGDVFGKVVLDSESKSKSNESFINSLDNSQIKEDNNTKLYFEELEKQSQSFIKYLNKLSSSASELKKDGLTLGDAWIDGELIQYQIYQSNIDKKTLLLNIPPQYDDQSELETIIQSLSFGFDEKIIKSKEYDKIIVTSFILEGSKRVHSKNISFRGNFLSNQNDVVNVLDPSKAIDYAEKIVYYFPEAELVTNFYDAVAYNKFSTPTLGKHNEKGVDESGKYEFSHDYLSQYATGNSNNGSAKEGGGSAIVGSVIAPKSTVILSGSSINGLLHAKNLHQRNGAEIHNFKVNWPKQDKDHEARLHVKKSFLDENGFPEDGLKAGFQLYKVFQGKKHYYYVKDDKINWTSEMIEETKIYTDENGEILFNKLDYGTYFLKEIEAPDNYEINHEVHRIIINEDTVSIDNQFKMTIEIENHKINKKSGEVKFRKTDSKQNNLKGAEFIIARKNKNNGNSREYLSDFDGKRYWVPNILFAEKIKGDDKGEFHIKGLELNREYEILETKAPEGYLPSGEYIRVEAFDPKFNEDNKLDIINEPDESVKTLDLKIKKISDSKNPEIDYTKAKFLLIKEGWFYRISGDGYTWVRSQQDASVLSPDEDGLIRISNLEFGKYVIREIEALDNHEIGNDVEILVDLKYNSDKNDFDDEFNDLECEGNYICVPYLNHVKQIRKFKIIKHDSDDSTNLLSEAKFVLEQKKNTIRVKIYGLIILKKLKY